MAKRSKYPLISQFMVVYSIPWISVHYFNMVSKHCHLSVSPFWWLRADWRLVPTPPPPSPPFPCSPLILWGEYSKQPLLWKKNIKQNLPGYHTHTIAIHISVVMYIIKQYQGSQDALCTRIISSSFNNHFKECAVHKIMMTYSTVKRSLKTFWHFYARTV